MTQAKIPASMEQSWRELVKGLVSMVCDLDHCLGVTARVYHLGAVYDQIEWAEADTPYRLHFEILRQDFGFPNFS